MFSKIYISVLHITDLSQAKPVGTHTVQQLHTEPVINYLLTNIIFLKIKLSSQSPIAESCRLRGNTRTRKYQNSPVHSMLYHIYKFSGI